MTETAVALFVHPGAAESVIDALRENGIPSDAIRMVAEPVNGARVETAGTPQAGTLSHELKQMGASESEAAAYARGVESGNVMVMVNGTPDQARTAIEVMNDFFAMDMDGAGLPGEHTPRSAVEGLKFPDRPIVNAVDNTAETTASASDPDVTAKIEHHRNRTDGARVFSW